MQLAVTNHAVERYQQRVPSAAKLSADSIRSVLKGLVEEAFEKGQVKEHPGHPERRMVEFSAGKQPLFLALGPNTTEFPGEWAVIGVLFDREVGQKGISTTLGDLIGDDEKRALALKTAPSTPKKARFLVRFGGSKSKEIYDVKDEEELVDLLNRRKPSPSDEVEVFERTEYAVKTVYTIVK